MKKKDMSRLKSTRPVAMKIGFILSLAFCLMAFNYTVEISEKKESSLNAPVEDIEDIEVTRTIHKKKQKPIPKINPTPKFEVVKEILNIESEPEKVSLEIDEEEEVFFPTSVGGDEEEIEPEIDEEEIIFEEEEAPLDFAQYMPRFGNCDASMSKDEYQACSDKAILSFFAKNLKYPTIARENGIEGKVYLKFVINEKGEVTNPIIVRELGGGCSREALRVLKKMPNWKPGRHGGKNVKVYYTIPVHFKLQ